MSSSSRLEISLVIAIVVVGAVFVRWIYIPPFPDRQVEASERKYDYDVGDPGAWFSAWSVGDGQAYTMIALDPTGRKLAKEIGEPGYRFARAGYGWAVWAVSLGRPTLVPYALALVGLLAVAGALIMAVLLRPDLGPRAWCIVLNPALFVGFAGDTSEPMGIALLTATLGLNSIAGAAVLGVTRPTFVVSLWGRWRLLIATVLVAFVVAAYGMVVFGVQSMIPDGGRLSAPLWAYVRTPTILGGLLALLAVATVVVGVVQRNWAWVISGLVVMCFGPDVVRVPANAWRAAGFLPVMWAFGHRATGEPPAQLRAERADVA